MGGLSSEFVVGWGKNGAGNVLGHRYMAVCVC